MIGDRYLTDVVYGNRHGLLTIRPAPLAVKGEPQMVQLVSSLLHCLSHSAATSYLWWASHFERRPYLACLCALSPFFMFSGAQDRGQAGKALDAPRFKGQLLCHSLAVQHAGPGSHAVLVLPAGPCAQFCI